MNNSWQKLQTYVLDLAATLWGRPAIPDRIDGVNFDGVIRASEEEIVLIEITEEHSLSKIRTDVAKIGAVKLRLSAQSVVARSYIVMSTEPTQGMKDAGSAHKIKVVSLRDFETEVFDYHAYVSARQQKPFGSAVNPTTGQPDAFAYIPVTYLSNPGNKPTDLTALQRRLCNGTKIVLLGDYGTGKSRCVKELFELLAADPRESGGYPMAINLRDHWGAQSGIEIISGHLNRLGLSKLVDRTMRFLAGGRVTLLLDGFDELGAQTFGSIDDETKRLGIRKQALAGVRDLIRLSAGTTLITGRPHYFNDNLDLLSSLGLNMRDNNIEIYTCRTEFQDAQANQYLTALGLTARTPPWLPKKPLMFQVLALIDKHDAEEILQSKYGEIGFWGQFIDTICVRESRAKETSIDPKTVRTVLTNLARQARVANYPLGRFSPRDVNRAYEDATGISPDEAGNLMLSRLCTLGRVESESPDRQFVDGYILQLLYSDSAIDDITSRNYSVLNEQYCQALQRNGLFFLAQWVDIYALRDEAIGFIHKETEAPNSQLVGEIVGALLLVDSTDSDFGGKIVEGAEIAAAFLSDKIVTNLTIRDCIIGDLFLAGHKISEASNVKILNSSIEVAHGIASTAATPNWVVGCSVQQAEAMSTSTRIKESKLPSAQKLFLSIIQKIFFQRGGGRKENTLFRGGYGQQFDKRMYEKILSTLLSNGIIRESKDSSGFIYNPNREFTGRMQAIRDQLTLSQDPLWLEIAKIPNK